MHLKRLYNTIIEEQKKLVAEYINNKLITFIDYLKISDEDRQKSLPKDYPGLFKVYLERLGSSYKIPIQYEKDFNESDGYDSPKLRKFINWLEDNDPKRYEYFAEWLFRNFSRKNYTALEVPAGEQPAWVYFGNDPEIVKNQWLIHFTNHADDIAREGFTKGVDSHTKLALTVHLNDIEKVHGGFNFAYQVSNFDLYGKKPDGNYYYGNDAVVFRASGVEALHYTDHQRQVIFMGSTATNIVPIKKNASSNKWEVRSKKQRLLYSSTELEDVVNWVIKNYDQYRKTL